MENLDESVASWINFELSPLDSEYFGEAVTDSVKEAPAEETDVPTHDSVQESDSSGNEEEDSPEWEDPLDTFTYYSGLRRATRHTGGVHPERLNYDTGLITGVMRGNGHITAPSSYT